METIKSTIPNYWIKHIKAWKRTGLRQAQYCRDHQLKPHQFSYFKCQFIKHEKLSSGHSNGFIEFTPPIYSATKNISSTLSLHLSQQQFIEGITSDNIHLIKPLLECLS